MVADDECMRNSREYVHLAGLTDRQNVREQLLDLARGWAAVAQHESHSAVRAPASGSRAKPPTRDLRARRR
jgi:hypothetical protein